MAPTYFPRNYSAESAASTSPLIGHKMSSIVSLNSQFNQNATSGANHLLEGNMCAAASASNEDTYHDLTDLVHHDIRHETHKNRTTGDASRYPTRFYHCWTEYCRKAFMCASTPKQRQRVWALTLYSLATVLLFADQNLLSPNLSAAAADFGFDDVQKDEKLGGHIAIAFFLVGAPASFLVGCLADSDFINRSVLFGVVVLIGEGSCMITYFTTTYTGLYVTRALTGFSVGGALPLLSSVLGDWYPPEDRSAVMATVGVGSGLGIALGQGISGMIGPRFGWRVPFLVISIPALFVACLVMSTVVDPDRGEGERIGIERRIGHHLVERGHERMSRNGDNTVKEQPQQIESFLPSGVASTDDANGVSTSRQTGSDRVTEVPTKVVLEARSADNFRFSCMRMCHPTTYVVYFQATIKLLRTPTVLLTLVQGAPGCIPWGIVNTYLNDYLSKNCGMTIQAATLTILVFGIGNFAGMVLGGVGGNFLYRRDVRYPSLFAGLMAILGCVPLWFMINSINLTQSVKVSISTWLWIQCISFLSGLGSGVTGPIVKAMLQNVTLPNTRGQAFAMLNTTDDFGRGLGPFFVSQLIKSMGSRQRAFNVGILGWVFCGFFVICMFLTVRRDEEKVQLSLLVTYRMASELDTGLEIDGQNDSHLISSSSGDSLSSASMDFEINLPLHRECLSSESVGLELSVSPSRRFFSNSSPGLVEEELCPPHRSLSMGSHRPSLPGRKLSSGLL